MLGEKQVSFFDFFLVEWMTSMQCTQNGTKAFLKSIPIHIFFNIVQRYAGLLEVYHIVLILFRFFFTMHYALQTLQYDKVRSF